MVPSFSLFCYNRSMIRNIVKDTLFLSKKSTPCTKEDLPLAADLKDTLKFHSSRCVGMAANMIGVSKRAIIITTIVGDIVMFNPVIKKKAGRYETTEGCLSLSGERDCVRFDSVTVEYLDENWKKVIRDFSGFPAQIIQHECDHLEGIII